jgi:hypothetical protein
LVDVGLVAFVTAIPPAVYPVPDTSPEEEYAVVAALIAGLAVVVYKAALNVSAVLAVCAGFAELKLCVALNNSPKKEVHIDWVLAMMVPLA